MYQDWEEWKEINSENIKHDYGYEQQFVEQILENIPEITPNDVIAQYPFKDFSGRDRRIDFLIKNEKKGYLLPIELDGYAKLQIEEGYERFNDFIERQNALSTQFGMLLRFTNKKMFNHAEEIISEIRQVLEQQAQEKEQQSQITGRKILEQVSWVAQAELRKIQEEERQLAQKAEELVWSERKKIQEEKKEARKAEEAFIQQQTEQERTQRQQTQSHQDVASKVANRDNPGCLIILIITTVAIIITGTIIIFMESLSHTPNSAASGYAASEAFAASDADFASSDERFDESTTEPESLTASSAANEALEMLRQQELVRQQAEQAERDRIAAEEQKQAELLSKQRKDCLQVARNIGYYETVASYCGLNPKRDLDSFTNEFNELACNQAVSDAEITEAAQRSERHLDTVIDNVTDQVAFCRKEYPFWSRVDNYQRY